MTLKWTDKVETSLKILVGSKYKRKTRLPTAHNRYAILSKLIGNLTINDYNVILPVCVLCHYILFFPMSYSCYTSLRIDLSKVNGGPSWNPNYLRTKACILCYPVLYLSNLLLIGTAKSKLFCDPIPNFQTLVHCEELWP